jgi:hypothetical protein
MLFWRNSEKSLHREDGLPAIVYITGYMSWYVDGSPHNADGPARVYTDRDPEFWVNGVQFTNDSFNTRTV